MSKSHVLAILGASLGLAALLGCMGPEPLVAGDKAVAAEQPSMGIDQNALPPELAGLSQDELCQLMCQSMGGMGAALCEAMHAAGMSMDMSVMMSDPETVQAMITAMQAAQPQ